MSAYEGGQENREIDIIPYIRQILNSFRKIWIVFILLPAAFAGLGYLWADRTYTPVYTASITVSVSVAGLSGDTYNNASTASQLGKVFPYILTSSALKDIIAADLGMSYVPGEISVYNLPETNFLTVKVSGYNPDLTYKVLQSVIKNYPEVAQHIVGRTVIEVIDDSGVPQTSGKASALRRAVRKGVQAGLAAACLFLAVVFMTSQTVLTSYDLKNLTNVPYLGTLPVYKKKRRHSSTEGISLLKNNVQRDYLEAMRVVRTRLDRKLAGKGNVILVSSTLPGEGKTTVAVNLALAFAQQKKEVVLVDCDLRNPSIQSVLNFGAELPGLAELLQGKCRLADTVYSYEQNGLKLVVLPGSAPDKAVRPELLRSEAMMQLINSLKEVSDIVILDTPPAGILADAEMVTRYADLAVYVVMCDYAHRSYIRKGIRELYETGITLGGVVLNAGKESSSGGYGSYGTYGSYGDYS